jgi:hypothetical protein
LEYRRFGGRMIVQIILFQVITSQSLELGREEVMQVEEWEHGLGMIQIMR